MRWPAVWLVGWACGAGVVTLDGQGEDSSFEGESASPPERDDSGGSLGSSSGFDPSFEDHLMQSGRADLVAAGGVGGGVPASTDHDPVVFIHGNGDRAVGGPLGGWTRPLEAYAAAGWDPARLFAVTWGPADPLMASQQTHGRVNIKVVRGFLEAVLDYTGAEKVDVVSHSMGVTLARIAIAGGTATDGQGTYGLGPALTERVDAFIGIAGANLGLSSCWATGGWVPTCGRVEGLWPGTRYGLGPVAGRSSVLEALTRVPGVEGTRRYALWSRSDEILGPGALVWGEVTARLPAQTGEDVLFGLGHLESRDETTDVQLGWLDHP